MKRHMRSIDRRTNILVLTKTSNSSNIGLIKGGFDCIDTRRGVTVSIVLTSFAVNNRLINGLILQNRGDAKVDLVEPQQHHAPDEVDPPNQPLVEHRVQDRKALR